MAAAAAAVVIRRKRSPRKGAAATAATASVSPLTVPTASEGSTVTAEKDAKNPTGEASAGSGAQTETAEPTSPRSTAHLNGENMEVAPAVE